MRRRPCTCNSRNFRLKPYGRKGNEFCPHDCCLGLTGSKISRGAARQESRKIIDKELRDE